MDNKVKLQAQRLFMKLFGTLPIEQDNQLVIFTNEINKKQMKSLARLDASDVDVSIYKKKIKITVKN